MALPYRAKALAMALMVNCSLTAHAHAITPEQTPLEIPAIVQDSLRDGDEVLHQFQDGDLRGWVVKPAGMKPIIAYTVNNDQVLIYGDAVSQIGSDYVKIHDKELIPYSAQAPVDLHEAFENAEKLAGFSEGVTDKDARHRLYVFFDPNCVFCHYTYLALRPYLEQTKNVQVRWIPIAVLGSQSVEKSAALIQSDTPLVIMKAVNAEWSETHGESFPTQGEASDELKAQVEGNTRFLRENVGSESTPTFLFRDHNGEPTSLKGMPSLAQFAKWFHTDVITNKNEKLIRFDNTKPKS